jgi:hypothetical protein
MGRCAMASLQRPQASLSGQTMCRPPAKYHPMFVLMLLKASPLVQTPRALGMAWPYTACMPAPCTCTASRTDSASGHMRPAFLSLITVKSTADGLPDAHPASTCGTASVIDASLLDRVLGAAGE